MSVGFYIDFGTSRQPLETSDDSALIRNNKVNSVVSRSVSCPTLTTVIPEHNDGCSQQDSQPETSTTQPEQEEKVVDCCDLVAQHSECCVIPSGSECPVETSEEVSGNSKEEETATASPTDTTCTSSTQQLPSTLYAYNWDIAAGQYHFRFLPATQSGCQYSATSHSPALSYVNRQCAASQFAPNTSYAGHMYSNGQAGPHSSPDASNHYAAYYTHLYQQYHASRYTSANSGYEAASSPDLQLPVSDRRSKLLQARGKRNTAAFSEVSTNGSISSPELQLTVQGDRRSKLLQAVERNRTAPEASTSGTIQTPHNSHSHGANYCPVRTFKPTVPQRDSQSYHSPAFPLVNGQYQTSPHIHQLTFDDHEPTGPQSFKDFQPADQCAFKSQY